MNIKHLLYALLFFTVLSTIDINGQTDSAAQSQSGKKGVIFKAPEGFMSAPFSKDKKGLMFLHAEKPSGMFILYTPDNQKSEDLIVELKTMFAGMFIHDEKGKSAISDLKWTETGLPAHTDITGEIGNLYTTSSGKYEVQVVTYVRTISPGQDVVYGYFAMKDNTSKKNSADFVDASGGGIKAFDKFRQTITVQKK